MKSLTTMCVAGLLAVGSSGLLLTTPATADSIPVKLGVANEFVGPSFTGAGTRVSVSGDGRYTVFESNEKLTSDATGDQRHVYRRDTASGAVQLVSVDARSTGTGGASFDASISDDGRYIAFVTTDAGLFPSDPVGSGDQIALRDMTAATTTLITSRGIPALETLVGSANSEEGETSGSPSISADGQHVAFVSNVPGVNNRGVDTTTAATIEVYDRATGDVTNIIHSVKTGTSDSEPVNGDSGQPALSADGRYIVFASRADDLGVAQTTPPISPLPSPHYSHVYRLDRTDGSLLPITLAAGSTATDFTATDGDSFQPSITADGSKVAFVSGATNLLGAGELVKKTQTSDAYVRDIASNTTHRVSLMLNDTATPSDSDKDTRTPSAQRTRYWSEAPGGASQATISADGSTVVMTSAGPLLDLSGDCVGCQQFIDDNDANDVYAVQLFADAKPRSVQPISARNNLKDTSTDARTMAYAVGSTSGNGDSIADGFSPVTDNGQTVVFGSQAVDLRGWDFMRQVIVGDTSFSVISPPILSPSDPRRSAVMYAPHYVDGGFPGTSAPQVRMFTENTGGFATHLTLPAEAAQALQTDPTKPVVYSTRRLPLPALTESPAVATVTSAFTSQSVTPGAHGIIYAVTAHVAAPGSAELVLDLNHFTLDSAPTVPSSWKRATDDATNTVTYTATHVEAGDYAFVFQLSEDDAATPSTASVDATVNTAFSTAGLAVRPAAPLCTDSDIVHVTIAGLPTLLRDQQCSDHGLALTAKADHGVVTIDASGGVHYTADSSYRGQDTVRIVATDSAGRVGWETRLNVDVSFPAEPQDDEYATSGGTPLTVDAAHGLLANDLLPTTPLEWHLKLIDKPAHGVLVLDTNTGSFTYTPEPDFSGDVTFDYTAYGPDANSDSPATKATIHVN